MAKLKSILNFLMGDFGPLLVFYGVNHFYELKSAVAASLSFGVLQIIYYQAKKRPLSTLFKYSLLITFIFGILDLSLKTPVFFRFEAAISNVLTAIFFGLTLRPGEKPLIQEAAEKRWADKNEKHEITEDGKYFFWFSTWAWTLYFVVKASFYAWTSLHYSLEEALAIRSVVGNVSLYGLIFVNIYFAKNIRALLAKLKLLPSARAECPKRS